MSKNSVSWLLIGFIFCQSVTTFAHDFSEYNKDTREFTVKKHQIDNKTTITYLGNEALFIESGNEKILFDPFFSHDFGLYQQVPEHLITAIMHNQPPFNDISAIFISHAHRDHFDADMMIKYLAANTHVSLFAANQAIKQIEQRTNQTTNIKAEQLHTIDLTFNSEPWEYNGKYLTVDAVRIPHAGWPARADVENLVFRVTFNNDNTIMHMGDADPDITHYLPYKLHWSKTRVNVNFPPYWFFMSAQGRDILFNVLNADKHIGIHVPKIPPKRLDQYTKDYFLTPLSKHVIK
ncbi:MBL fold metallo-hydrolase [Thalassotalea sp. 1_MG-2023]|uniref:MBL fold metallo-hydrolase n=1 Tax=Thalassotalea sp. 1_MG-2023 TaxID=3062680 RepID=UPI0026E183D7|nr:MBL fold metallo-hydrolase [Thalassotalea sp. 1_MG-2023]MDO6427798.1 MBL fold metallo-hydrolase [Thalassotalea sp. 1_MG-2023]